MSSDDPPTGPQEPSWIELDGVVNMRDLGGLPTVDGGYIEPGRLIRSDNLQDLAPASVAYLLEDVGVTDIVDLRTLVEVAKEGDGPLVGRAGIRIHQLTLYPEDSSETGIPAGERDLPWHRDPQLGDTSRGTPTETPDAADLEVEPVDDEAPRTGITIGADAAADDAGDGTDEDGTARHDAYWSEHYLTYLQQRPDHVVAALRAIGEAQGAVVVHCAAGKDRTGTVVALALKAVGATDDAVVADFAASAQRVPQILERLAGRPAYTVNLEGKTVTQQSPRTDTMRMLLATLDREYGGVDGWLARQGWTADDGARLRGKLRS